MGLKPLKTTKNKKGALSGYFWREHPLFWTWKLRFWNRVSVFGGGRHIQKKSKTYPKSNFGWYGPPNSEDQLMHNFLNNLHKYGNYSAQISGHQVELRRGGNIDNKSFIFALQIYYLILEHSVRNTERAVFLNQGAVTVEFHTQMRNSLRNI